MFYTPRELAKEMKVSEKYLANMRKKEGGIPHVRIGNLVRYPIDQVEQFFNNRLKNQIGGHHV